MAQAPLSLTPFFLAKRLATRAIVPGDPVKCFQRTLSGHLAATDGRMAFSAEEEAAILTVLQKKQQWPAFRGTTSTIGMRGYRSMGFHEKRAPHRVFSG